jgi:CRP/FNR family cyclic AMP-dependent transcriptional regulator
MRTVLGLFRNAEDFETRAAGRPVFQAGTPGACMYVVKSGRLAIQIDGETVETVEAGGVVGEMSLLDNAPRSATVVALTDAQIVPIDQKRFLFMIQQTPFFAIEVMRIMAERLRAMNRRATA